MVWHNPSIDSAHVVERANPVTMRTDQKWINISHSLTPGKALNTTRKEFLRQIQCHFVHRVICSHTLTVICVFIHSLHTSSLHATLLSLSWLLSPFCLYVFCLVSPYFSVRFVILWDCMSTSVWSYWLLTIPNGKRMTLLWLFFSFCRNFNFIKQNTGH